MSNQDDSILHYGVARRSGRYPWGSGKDPQRNVDLLTQVDYYKHEKGMNEKQIAAKLGMKSTAELRSKITLANVQRKVQISEQVKIGLDRGDSIKDIAKRVGQSESSIRNYAKQDPTTVNKAKQIDNIKKTLAEAVDKNQYLDVGKGVELQIGITKEKMKAVVNDMVENGYTKHTIYLPQLTNPGKNTTLDVLTKDTVDKKEVFANLDKVRPVTFHTEDGGANMQQVKPFTALDWDRVHIRYNEEGGVDKDGVMELRPGVKDLDMGNAHYAQVRIAVGENGGSHYLKGMAIYGDEKDFPKGADVIFNTNKSVGTPKEKVLKKMKDDPDNPFGASITRQADLNTKENMALPDYKRKKGAVNIVNEEGSWSDWSKTLPAQMLSKQPRPVVKERLEATLKKVDNDLDEIMKVTNPVVREKLLDSYKSDLESKQVHLKALAPAKTLGHVILPVPNMKETEIYAPRYKDGDNVILIRYPHGGTFEIPELRVNNKGPGKKVVGPDAPDAIGIHPKVAAKLSGADFDGDTVYVIPNNHKKFVSRNALDGLKDFDPNIYQDKPGTFKPVTSVGKQKQMGIVSNLITDMTLHGATDSELARAVRHSMVVIDSEKHELNYRRSERENGIKALQKKYMDHIEKVDYKKLGSISEHDLAKQAKAEKGLTSGGASTIISRHKQEVEYATPKTKVEEYNVYNSKGEVTGTKTRLKNTGKKYLLNAVDDASVLSSGTPIEKEYVKYVNGLKSRAKTVDTLIAENKKNMPKKNPAATLAYKAEVQSLNEKLKKSLLNGPNERLAQVLATQNYRERLARATGEIDKDQKKKYKQQSLAQARLAAKAERNPVKITDSEWEAIQSNAISPTSLRELIKNMDDKQLKTLATPRDNAVVSTATKSRIKAMRKNGLTLAQIAEATGVSVSTIADVTMGKVKHSIDYDDTTNILQHNPYDREEMD